jgi:hypothetical protein
MTRVIDGPVSTGFPGGAIHSFVGRSRRPRLLVRSHLASPPLPPSPFQVSATLSFPALRCNLPPPSGSSLAWRLPSRSHRHSRLCSSGSSVAIRRRLLLESTSELSLSIYLSHSGSTNDSSPTFFPRSRTRGRQEGKAKSEAGRVRLRGDPSVLRTGSSSW